MPTPNTLHADQQKYGPDQRQSRYSLNPFTVPVCKISRLKIHGRVCQQHIFWSFNKSTFIIFWSFNKSTFIIVCLMKILVYANSKERKKKKKKRIRKNEKNKDLIFFHFYWSFSTDITAVTGLRKRTQYPFKLFI